MNELDSIIAMFDEHCEECATCAGDGRETCERGSELMRALMDVLSQPDYFLRRRKGAA